jgi:hypothetical protein
VIEKQGARVRDCLLDTRPKALANFPEASQYQVSQPGGFVGEGVEEAYFEVLQSQRLQSHRRKFSLQVVTLLNRFGANASLVFHGQGLTGVR